MGRRTEYDDEPDELEAVVARFHVFKPGTFSKTLLERWQTRCPGRVEPTVRQWMMLWYAYDRHPTMVAHILMQSTLWDGRPTSGGDVARMVLEEGFDVLLGRKKSRVKEWAPLLGRRPRKAPVWDPARRG